MHSTTTHDPSPRAAARVAALGYVTIFVLAIFANFAVVERLIDPDDDATTFANLSADATLLRWAIAAFVVIFVADVVIAWALHLLLRPFGAAWSALAAWFRIVYTVFLGVAVVALIAVLGLVTGTDGAAFGGEQRIELTSMALGAFDVAWMVGLVAFGLHLAAVGSLMIRHRSLPSVLGSGLVVAGAAYVLDTGAIVLDAGYADHAGIYDAIVISVAVTAELGFTGWLVGRARHATADTTPVGPAARTPILT